MKKIILILLFTIFQISFSQWEKCFNGINGNYSVNCLAVGTDRIYAGVVDFGIISSVDYGNSWINANDTAKFTKVLSIGVKGDSLLVGTEGSGLFVSYNKGNNWNIFNDSLIGINTIVFSGNNIIAGAVDYNNKNNGLFISTNNGISWLKTNSSYVYSLASFGNNVCAATSSGLCLSIDNGLTWSKINHGLMSDYNTKVVSMNNDIIIAESMSSVGISIDNGKTWSLKSNGLQNSHILSILINGNNIFLGTTRGVFISNDSGLKWSQKNYGLNPDYIQVNRVIVYGNFIYAGTSDGIYRAKLSDLTDVYADNPILNEFQIFPNPTSYTISLNLPPEYQSFPIKIYSIEGIEVYNSSCSGTGMPVPYDGNIKINVSCFAPGVYYIKVVDKVCRFVKI